MASRIFLSHSSKDAALTTAVAEALSPLAADAPAAKRPAWGYEVLVDQTELKPGVEWPRYLHEWMARADAAVILLTTNAVASDWVLKEATILAWRRSLDPGFSLFVVRFPDVTNELLEKHHFSPLFLSNIQAVGQTDAAAIATAVRDQLGPPQRVETRYDAMVRYLADPLAKVSLDTLKAVAAKLNVVPQKFKIVDGERVQYVDAIARHLVCGVLGDFAGVHELANALSGAGGAVVRDVLQRVYPYWIEEEVAGRLPPLLSGKAPRRAAGLNGSLLAQFTAEMFVLKAHAPALEQVVIPIAGGWDGKIVAHVTHEICEFRRTRTPALKSFTDAAIVQHMRGASPRWYAILPGVPDPASLDTLIDTFPAVTFVLWTGDVLARDARHTRVEWLEPGIDVARESTEFDHYAAAEDIIAKLS